MIYNTLCWWYAKLRFDDIHAVGVICYGSSILIEDAPPYKNLIQTDEAFFLFCNECLWLTFYCFCNWRFAVAQWQRRGAKLKFATPHRKPWVSLSMEDDNINNNTWLVCILEKGIPAKNTCCGKRWHATTSNINHVCGKTSCVCKLCCASVALKNSILLAKTCILKILRTNCLLSIEKSPKKCYNFTKQCNKCIL